MRAQSKAVLKTKLQVEQSSRIHIYCHHRWMCHVVNRALAHEWHRCGLRDQLHGYHQVSSGTPWRLPDIWRYVGNSPKQMTRSSRSGNDASRKHQRSLHTTLPTPNVALNVVHNKVQLINLICHYLINHIKDHKLNWWSQGKPNTGTSMEQFQSPERRSENKPRQSRCHHRT